MAISPFFKPTKVIRPAGGGLISAARNNIRSLQTKTQNISEPRSDNKSQKFGSAYTNFFGSKKTVKILQKNLTAIKKSLASTFEIAIALRKSIAQTAKGFGGGGKKGGLFGGLFGGLGGLLGIGGGLIGLISGLFSALTNPWVLGLLGAGSLLAAVKIIFSDNDVSDFIKEFLKTALGETIYPGSKENLLNTNKLNIDQTIDQIGPSDALAVFKGRLEALKSEREIGKWNWFDDNNREIRDLQRAIKKLDEMGVTPSDMSGSQYELNLANYEEGQISRLNLKRSLNQEQRSFPRKFRDQRLNDMPVELRSGFFNMERWQYEKETESMIKEWQKNFRENEILPRLNNFEVKNNQTKDVSSSSTHTTNKIANATVIPFSTGGGNKTGNGVNKVFSPNGNTTTTSDIAWFNSRNTDMYGCFKTAAECNITV